MDADASLEAGLATQQSGEDATSSVMAYFRLTQESINGWYVENFASKTMIAIMIMDYHAEEQSDHTQEQSSTRYPVLTRCCPFSRGPSV
jgi:hypothetical protein